MEAQRKQWFIDRIGKRIWRNNPRKCPCRLCQLITTDGIIITDMGHAIYLAQHEVAMGYKYRDTKQQ